MDDCVVVMIGYPEMGFVVDMIINCFSNKEFLVYLQAKLFRISIDFSVLDYLWIP